MITVFSCTNRPNSNSEIVARFIFELLQKKSKETVQFFALKDLPSDLLHSEMYDGNKQSETLKNIQDQYLIPADKFYFITPEYNGGIPGIFKLFIDACSVRNYNESFKGGKKAALVGVSSGRSGNLRGMEYMTGFLNYLGIHVFPNKLPISSIETILHNGIVSDTNTLKVLEEQLTNFLDF